MNKKEILKNTFTLLPDEFYTYEKERSFNNPEIFLFNYNLVETLGINEFLSEFSDDEKAEILSANKFIKKTKPISQAYAGHQFGHFNILGDGRALLLAELELDNNELYDIHLKGSGATVYSRGGDGLASFESVLREYLISEAMYGLKIPTTRSLAILKTNKKVYRNKIHDGAILVRLAKSHIRVGTFTYAKYLGTDKVRELADYTIKRHYKDLENTTNKYQGLLRKVIDRQASLIANWMGNAFIHGVMNTDNMLVSGETIDYGPCAFMDVYNPDTVFSSIDSMGRYRYSNQKYIGLWNLSRFAESLLPVLSADKHEAISFAENELDKYKIIFDKYYYEKMVSKIGFNKLSAEVKNLLDELLFLMYVNKADYTNTFVRLTLDLEDNDGTYLDLTADLFKSKEFEEWYNTWLEILKSNKISNEEAVSIMRENNPFIIPRNEMIEKVILECVNGKESSFKEYIKALKDPFNYNENNKRYQKVNIDFSKNYKTYCGT